MSSNPDIVLPAVSLPTAEVEVAGVTVTARSLSRSDAIRVSTKYDKETVDEAEIFILSRGTGVSMDAAREWLGSVGVDVAAPLMDKIIELSGLNPDLTEDGEIISPKDDGSKN